MPETSAFVRDFVDQGIAEAAEGQDRTTEPLPSPVTHCAACDSLSGDDLTRLGWRSLAVRGDESAPARINGPAGRQPGAFDA